MFQSTRHKQKQAALCSFTYLIASVIDFSAAVNNDVQAHGMLAKLFTHHQM